MVILYVKKYRFLCKCNTYNGQMTSSASISGFLFGNAADIYPDQAFSCFVGKTVQFASVGYKVSGFPAWIMLHSLKQRSAVLLESQNMVLDSSVEPLYWEHHSDSLHTDIRKLPFINGHKADVWICFPQVKGKCTGFLTDSARIEDSVGF